MVTEHMVHKGSTRIPACKYIYMYLNSHDYHMTTDVPVSSNGHALIDTIGGVRDNVVEFIGHTSRS